MFKILIVEDTQDKVKKIYEILETNLAINVDRDVEVVMDANDAKRKMENQFFDFLILDISIPMRKSQEVDPEGGLKLLDEIQTRTNYKTPSHIIGLTANEKVFGVAENNFRDKGLTIIRYEIKSDAWQSQLESVISQKIRSKGYQDVEIPSYDYDCAIICALTSELQANRDNGWHWTPLNFPNDDTVYYEVRISNDHGKQFKIVAAACIRMGMPATTALTAKMISIFRPKLVAMTGIMAGNSKKTSLGDLVFGSPVWDWGNGKWITKASEDKSNYSPVFQIDPYQFTLDGKILKIATVLSDDKQFLFDLRKTYGKNAPDHDINIKIGPVASGAAVLADKSLFSSILDQNRNLIGVEMEAYGLFCAVETSTHPKPVAFCVKSVVDFGDKEKGDDHQHFGAYASAMCAKAVINIFINE